MSGLSLESLAGRIQREHEAALRDAGSAINHARAAGKLLLEARERGEGKWLTWLSENCPEIAERTAQKYMQLARHPEIEAKSIGEALIKLAAPREPNNPPGRAARQGPDSKGKERPATESNAAPAPSSDPSPTDEFTGSPDDPSPDADEEERIAAFQREHDAAVERVLGGAGAQELDRMSRELGDTKIARDGFMNGKAELERLLKAANAKIDRQEKRIKRLEAENKELRDQIAKAA